MVQQVMLELCLYMYVETCLCLPFMLACIENCVKISHVFVCSDYCYSGNCNVHCATFV